MKSELRKIGFVTASSLQKRGKEWVQLITLMSEAQSSTLLLKEKDRNKLNLNHFLQMKWGFDPKNLRNNLNAKFKLSIPGC